MSAFTSSIKYCTGGSTQENSQEKEIKGIQNRKEDRLERHKFISIHR